MKGQAWSRRVILEASLDDCAPTGAWKWSFFRGSLKYGRKTSCSHKQMTLGWSGDTQSHPAVVLMDGKQPFTEKVVLVWCAHTIMCSMEMVAVWPVILAIRSGNGKLQTARLWRSLCSRRPGKCFCAFTCQKHDRFCLERATNNEELSSVSTSVRRWP